MRIFRQLVLALCLGLFAAPGGVQARPYALNDMLRLESYGQMRFTPDGRHYLVERRGRYDRAASYGYDWFSRRLTSRILIGDVAAGGLRPLFPQRADAGYWMGGLSPSGRRMTVFRLDANRLALGVVTLASGRVRWLPVDPDLPPGKPDPIWIDDDRLAIATCQGLPTLLSFAGEAQRRLPPLWRMQQAGRRASVTVVGTSGPAARRPAGALILFDLRHDHVRPLLRGEIADIALSPDASLLAVLRLGEDTPHDPHRLYDGAEPLRRHQLRLVRLRDGAVEEPCPDCDLLPDLLSWSASGNRLLVFARVGTTPWQDGRLRVVQYGHPAVALDTGDTRPQLTRPQEGVARISAVWMGRTPVFFGSQNDGSRPGWYAAGAPVRSLDAQLLATPSSQLLAADVSGVVVRAGSSLFRIAPSGSATMIARSVMATALQRDDPFLAGSRALFASPATDPVVIQQRDGSADLLLSSPVSRTTLPIDPTCRPVAFDPAGLRALCVRRDAQGVGSLLIATSRTSPRVVDRINTHLAAVEPATALALGGGNAGMPVDWLYLPPGRDAAARLPLIVIPYPETVFTADRPPQSPDQLLAETSAALLAGQGYAVLLPSLPLGREVHATADVITAEVDRAVDAALATGRIDADRIAIYGHSYGGYAALILAGSRTRYHAIIASAANGNLVVSYGAPDPRTRIDMAGGIDGSMAFAWHETGQGRMGAAPWKEPRRYLAASPFFSLPAMHAPLLLIQGDLDYVPLAEGEQLFMGLHRLGRDVTLLRYWGESHVLTSPANIRDQYQRIFAWLARTLAPRHQDQALAQSSSVAPSTSAP
ncbi:alpha/beta hydrolase family protein [Flavisphingomonas formosensis]|uniref:alpha/beta hydrolase family protein n=1 Tax=Flavisphingomonas formosensis TaxID=861534 RepID=UPI0012FA936F|nr:prolyl oligopeptidase family serine peptidase [Sphingomonas formosensis]